MKFQERRKQIIHTLLKNKEPVTGTSLAELYQVTRPIIVGDIASLRSDGYKIISTPKGYRLLMNSQEKIKKIILCKHGKDQVEDELMTIIRMGGTIYNTGVEHDIYGQIEASLHLSSMEDVHYFMQRMCSSNQSLLSAVNDGIHTHLIGASSVEVLESIVNKLEDIGVLYKR